jgi:hypothetical protein
LTVGVPARDEAQTIGRTLSALARQTNAGAFDVVVFANNCTDATARLARAAGRSNPQLRIAVVEGALPPSAANVGSARKILLDGVAERFISAGRPHGIVATTDADTVVAPDWVRRTREEMRRAEAVAGFVEIGPEDQLAMPPAVRALYGHETAFRRAWTQLESLIDPRPEDPFPRHGAFVGASMAVTAELYVRAGGIPPIACLEDREFLAALRRVDARIRHSLDVRAFTSDRRQGRVAGGFGTFVNHLYTFGSSGRTFLVRDPHQIVRELELRASLRRMWQGDAARDDVVRARDALALDEATLRAHVDRREPFGALYERIVERSNGPISDRALVPVDVAISVLRAAVEARVALAPIASGEPHLDETTST